MKNVIYREGDNIKAFSASEEPFNEFVASLDESQILWFEGEETSVNTSTIKDWEVILKHFTKRWSTSKQII